MTYAPLIIFCYRRRDSLRRAVEALAANPEAPQTDLYIFSDGARGDDDRADVEDVRAYARNIAPGLFKSVTLAESMVNKGLGPSIIAGVTEVINRHGSAIVVEDDLVVLPNFLAFINEGLRTYSANREVFSICGYSNKVSIPHGYDCDAYFCPRSSSWGWATWADRWMSVRWDFDNWNEWKSHRRGFNAWGGSDCFSMLDDCRTGRNHSWAIRFCFAQYLQNALSLFPVKSLVANDGFDDKATNCHRWSRFRYELLDPSKTRFFLPRKINVVNKIRRSALSYHSLAMRAWSKIMYMLYK